MRLSILILQESSLARKINTKMPLRWIAHHISEIYLLHLPKIDINGSSKIVLEFGAQGNEVAFDNMFGCTNIFVEDFDFLKFYSLSMRERELILLDEIKRHLVSIYKRQNNNKEDIQSIISTANKIAEIGFRLDIPVKKLQKNTKDRQKK